MIVRQAVVKLLRGEYNSVRYRYIRLPKEWVEYVFCYRLFGKDWTAFYTDRMNHEAEISRDTRPSDRYLDQSASHLEDLRAVGMQPHHRLLDYGCGVMRTGMTAIPYLASGRYTGVDISAVRIEKGRDLLAESGIEPDTYEAFTVTDCDLKELQGRQFDYVWAQSVLTHMPVSEIRVMLRAMRPLIAPDGQFLFTFSADESYKRRHVKDFWYPEDFMEQECRAAGYDYELVASGTIGQSRLARLTLAKAEAA
jgi:cyclopropane fatty-acyl-phospholipid synthase-like methyltransferase